MAVVLIVAATDTEIAPVMAALGRISRPLDRLSRHLLRGHTIDVLTTGAGMVPAAAWTSRALGLFRYDLALDLGVCGSFDRTLGPGTVVHVVSDRMAELGAEDGDGFLTLADLRLDGEEQVVNAAPPALAALAALPAVSGITVNRVHGNEQTIAEVVARWHPQVESMEGAGFMYACAIHRVPFAQVRAVSNVVERRNRAGWRLPEAISNLGRAALEILNDL